MYDIKALAKLKKHLIMLQFLLYFTVNRIHFSPGSYKQYN